MGKVPHKIEFKREKQKCWPQVFQQSKVNKILNNWSILETNTTAKYNDVDAKKKTWQKELFP